MSNKFISKIYEDRDAQLLCSSYCLSVTVEDLNLQQRCRYKDIINILGTYYFVVLNSTLGAW